MNSRTQIIVDAEALRHNVQQIKCYLENSDTRACPKVIAMLKANAYGHGMKYVSQVLEFEVDIFGVACLQEAKTLRSIMPKKSILIMGGVFANEEWSEVFSDHFDVVIHSFWQIESLLSFCSENFNTACSSTMNVWLKIDSGMHRLGFNAKEIFKAYEAIKNCHYIRKPIGWMTHFACADETQNPMTKNQIEQFESTLACLPPDVCEKRSLANSAGIIAWPNARQGYVRPGIMLYGVSPFKHKTGEELGLRPVMCFQSHIIAIKKCETGESVGYGAIWRADQPVTIAIVGAGYGDGYPRHINADAKVWIKGKYYAIVGRVSMDMLAVNISDSVDISIGEIVELWGTNLPVEVVASFADTSPYELVTQIHTRGEC